MISDVVDALRVRPLRRRCSDDVKAQFVAESYALGAVVSEVARRHEISPQLLSAWRKAARHGLLKPPDCTEPTAGKLVHRTVSAKQATLLRAPPSPTIGKPKSSCRHGRTRPRRSCCARCLRKSSSPFTRIKVARI